MTLTAAVFHPWYLLPCLVLFGVGGNLTNISVNTQAVGVERLYKHKPIMASFHGLWSLAGFVAAAIGSFMIGHAVTSSSRVES